MVFNNKKNISRDQAIHPQKRKPAGLELLPVLFLVAACIFLPKGTDSESLNSLALIFVSIILEAVPFMLVGSVVGGCIEVFISRERMTGLLSASGRLTVFVAAGAGIVFPVCECAVVPVVRRLLGKGLPLSAAIAYLLAGPIVNPVVAASTALAYAFDWRIVLLRVGLGYSIAVITGLLMGKFFSRDEAVKFIGDTADDNAHSCRCTHHDAEQFSHEGKHGTSLEIPMILRQEPHDPGCGCGCDHDAADSLFDKTGAAFSHAKDDFLAVGHYLVIGAFIAAIAQTYLDRSDFLSLTASPLLSVVFMMAMAIMLNLCSEADAFIAASFRGLAPVSAQMAFLLTGPMFDLKLLLMYQSVFTRRAIVYLASLVLALVLFAALSVELLYGMFR